MLDELFSSKASRGVTLAKKWSANDFFSGTVNRRSFPSVADTGLSPETKKDFDRAVREAELKYAKLDLDYDKIFQELTLRRKELKQLIEEYKMSAKPQDVALFWNADIQLLTQQLRLIENKQKLAESKFKNVREEKKLIKENVKEVPTVNVNTQNNPIVTNNPMAVASAPESYGVVSVGGFSGTTVETPKKMIEKSSQSEPEVITYTPSDVESSSTTPEATVVSTPSVNTNLVLGEDALGLEKHTIGDVISGQNARIMERLKNKDKALNINTTMSNSYQDSLNAILNKRKDMVEKMFLVVEDGSFYTRAFERNHETGAYDIPVNDYHYKSVTHLGELRVNTVHKEVTTYYYPEPLKYEVVADKSDMPIEYRNWWSEPKSEKYRLTQETIESVLAAN